MKTKRILSVLILFAAFTNSAVRAQPPAVEPIYPPPSPIVPNAEVTRTNGTTGAPSGGLSDWIVYNRDCCEGADGRYTPMFTEAYFSAGPSFPFGNQTLGRELQPGWSFKTGLRALFFDASQTKAWVADLHVINTNESAGARGTTFPVTVIEKGVKIEFGKGGLPGAVLEKSNRTLAGLGFGRDWYLWQPANAEGRRFRVGVDAGGRYGSQRVTFIETGHLTDVIGAMYVGVRSDVEFPWQRCLFHAGARLEWSYTWSDILQQTSDVQDLNLFLTVGIRY